MSWEDALVYVGAWLVAAAILAFLCYGLDWLFPVEPEDEE